MPEYLPKDSQWKDPAHVQFAEEPTAQFVLFTNARVYDGKSNVLSDLQEVLIHKNLIRKVGKLVPVPQDVKLIKIDCDGKTLMPGLIDMHSHVCIQEGMMEGRDEYDQMAMGAMCAHDLLDYLQQGFTTCRDAGGNALGIAKAVQKGRIAGPRIYPSGGFITQTGGHGDTGFCFDQPGDQDCLEKNGFCHICDGRAEVLKACRNNIRNGATQIKLMASGTVSGPFNGFETTQFTLDEMKAAVEVAADHGTYVMAHAYHDKAINRAIDAGVKCIEHGYLLSETTMRRMAEEDVAISIQATMSLEAFADPDALSKFNDKQKTKAALLFSGAKKMMDLVHKFKPLTIAGGSLFGRGNSQRQADNVIHMVAMGGFSHSEALKSATSAAATVLRWCGPLNPYTEGTLGVIEEGAYADVLVVNGNPLEDIYALKRSNIELVMKDGKCHKFTLKEGSLQVVTFRVGKS